MEVKPEEAEGQVTYEGKTYYFCSEECQEQFKEHPQRYIIQKVR
jgi:Cu+-exporting ATPase